MGEFELIAWLVDALGGSRYPADPAMPVGPGDDAAVLRPPGGCDVVVTTDTLVAGVHFTVDAPAAGIGHKSLAVNLSDLAAMGADPAWYFLALTLPDADTQWLAEFARGMRQLAEASGVAIAGGDLTQGPLSITITAVGLVPRGSALLRAGAGTGDAVVVSGHPGWAALGLVQWQQGGGDEAALAALHRPQPRLALGRALRNKATACIDVSDGLAADLGHILESSRRGAELRLADLPLAGPLASMEPGEAWRLALAGGDDYELCFTLPVSVLPEIPALEEQAGIDLHVIGRITAEPGLRILDAAGGRFELRQPGFDHFFLGTP